MAARNSSDIRHLNADTEELKQRLLSSSNPVLPLPLPNGSTLNLELQENTLMPAALASKFPELRSYDVVANEEIVSGKVEITTLGFHASLTHADGSTTLIEPESSEEYVSYRPAPGHHQHGLQCLLGEGHVDHIEAHAEHNDTPSMLARPINGITEYRIAISATGEYTQKHGGTKSGAMSAILTTLNRVNKIYESSLGLRLQLVENNDLLIHTNSTQDPYNNYSLDSLLSENQQFLDRTLGSHAYDLGHVFGTYGGGLAYISSLCHANSKGKGASGLANPEGERFAVSFVAHEIGHQLGATHTFNGNQGICTGGARTQRSAVEPGSGSSIMSYAGGCGVDNIASSISPMFHSTSIKQITNNVAFGRGSQCGMIRSLNNQAPSVDAGADFTIPAHTPFELTANAYDSDGDSLSYAWDQMDTGVSTGLGIDNGTNPLFKPVAPSASATRSFPSTDVLRGIGNSRGEMLPETNRKLNFSLAVYDGKQAPSLDQKQLTVVDTGRAFKILSNDAFYRSGSNVTLTWDTASTQLAPIYCAYVDLELSVDDGQNFDHTIATQLPNSGSAAFQLPQSVRDARAARFKLSCSNNIFFAMSASAFSIALESDSPRAVNTTASAAPATAPRSGGGSMDLWFALIILAAAVSGISRRK